MRETYGSSIADVYHNLESSGSPARELEPQSMAAKADQEVMETMNPAPRDTFVTSKQFLTPGEYKELDPRAMTIKLDLVDETPKDFSLRATS